MDISSFNSEKWHQEDEQVFWGEIAPSDHVVQIYENDQSFLDLLSGFVIGGIRTDEIVIVIATSAHLAALDERLKLNGFDPFYLKLRDKYIPLDASETLSGFMVDGWPDEMLFNHVVSSILLRAKRNGTKVRAFGEMVALLWAQGFNGATVQLEHLWNKFCASESFCLFCAYPRSGFTDDPRTSMQHICGAHSKVIAGVGKNSNDILYTSNTKQSIAS